MPDNDITIGELSRNLVAMEYRIDKRFAALDKRFDSLQFVNRETYAAQTGALIDRVEALEDDKTWTRRTFIAAFLYPTLVAVLAVMAVMR